MNFLLPQFSLSLHRFTPILCIFIALLGITNSVSAPITINHHINGVVYATGTEEHFIGEIAFDDGNIGISFSTPTTIYLDENFRLTTGITIATKWIGTLTGNNYRIAQNAGGFLAGSTTDPNATVAISFPGNTTRQITGGFVTWVWDLSPLPDNDVTVESAFASAALSPGVGTFQLADNTLQRFSAPEFVYMNASNIVLGGIDNGSPGTPPNLLAVRRARCIGYAIDGQNIQGVERFFERTITEDIKVIWQWELESAVLIESATGENGFGNPAPGIGRIWVKNGTQVSAAIDSVVNNDQAGIRFRTRGYELSGALTNIYGSGRVLDPADSRAVTDNFVIQDWLRIRWLWDGQARYRFDAIDGDLTPFNGEAFLQKLTASGDPDGAPIFASGTNTPVWLTLGTKVKIGAFYRTADNCTTLGDFATRPTGDLSDIGADVSKFGDEMIGGRVARVRTIDPVSAPTEVHWFYRPTVFRAEIPLGQAFNAYAPDAQLVPNLCDGAILKLGDVGPGDVGVPIGDTPDGLVDGKPLEWDQVGQRLFPVSPGTYRIEWPDLNKPGETYTVEIVSDYPGDTAQLVSDRENENGMRQGTAPNYVRTANMAEVEDHFPAQPVAHYRHLFDADPNRQAPTKLDLNKSDEWFFQRVTYSDKDVDPITPPGDETRPFNTGGAGRSVLLFSYRPNPDEIADGTLTDEALAVRIVDSTERAPVAPGSPSLVLGQRGLALGEDSIGVVGPAPNIEPGENFTIDFWLNARDLTTDSDAATILKFGEPGLTITLDPSTATLTADYFGLQVVQPFALDRQPWKHIVLDVYQPPNFLQPTTQVDLYLDGQIESNAIRTAQFATAPPLSATVVTTPNASGITFGGSASTPIQIDQFHLFAHTINTREGIPASELRALRSSKSHLLTGSILLLSFDFETSLANAGNLTGLSLGPSSTATRTYVALQEVATRIDSALDNAGFKGSGYLINSVSNYNANLYDRDAEIGTWGFIFPVNHSRLFPDAENQLEVAYYENPFRIDPTLNPNIAWPYIATKYQNVGFPANGPHRDKAIYIASRIGSEGVDRTGRPQQSFDLATYSDLAIYNQPIPSEAGYNPNEEHALAAGSNLAGLKLKTLGVENTNIPPLAAFALQNEINTTIPTGYTSDPWVVIQVNNTSTGEPEMAAYQVLKTREGGNAKIAFPRPADTTVTAATGLEYLSAPLPENRLLQIDPAGIYNFQYTFSYPAAAGDLLIPPYPLNLVVGNISMPDNRGGNIQNLVGRNQRALWRDVNDNAWVVSGGGKFFHQFFYPFRNDFFLENAELGQPVAWLPDFSTGFIGDFAKGAPELDDAPRPVKVRYETFWRSSYPKLKRGETLAYQGGEYFNEKPGANGLPAVVAMAATELIYDSLTPDMAFNDSNERLYSARIIRPLDRREASFTSAAMETAGFTPAASSKIFIIAERWYFKELPGSLQRRFYFDSLAEKLVFRGLLNDKESGDSDLTSGPDPINSLEPNILTPLEIARLKSISTDMEWKARVQEIADLAANPEQIRVAPPAAQVITNRYMAGLREKPTVPGSDELDRFWINSNGTFVRASVQPDSQYAPLNSFGAGSALVPSPFLLQGSINGPLYVTIAENNRTELNGAAISLHIVEIIPDRYRGAVKVIEPTDAFSEKISLQHNGEFGANTGDLYYEWWIRDAAPLDVVANEINPDGTLKEMDSAGNSLWQEYIPEERAILPEPAKHLGMHKVVFEGRPDVTLADKLVLVRYRHRAESSWNLVPFEIGNPSIAWSPGTPAPFQWAGAANSPQLQADGSKRYIPQLVMGWVKRVLDRINPYEARYNEFFSNESPAAYSSQIQIAGAPFAGRVALNSDKNVIENTGLIELYETVLARARELSIDNSTTAVGSDGINQALLLAATRLSVLYELLAREAYSDAQDPTITVTGVDGLSSVASFTHAFQNIEADLHNEELALLRGTDFRKSFPVFNRMFWNYAKGLGEAAYNVNYNIYDENTDGFINEDDARALFPQGHGDAWGHFMSAIDMHYTLLQHELFTWGTRSELYSLMQNVLEVDFLDEKTFIQLAAGKARAGRDIVRGTYRQHYTQNPDGQWQGYSDSADPARAWGVSEWGHRAAQGAYFDWAVANALLPEEAGAATAVENPIENPENLDRIERAGAIDEIGEIAAGLHEIQVALDEANGGVNPLGFDSEAMTFDIYPRAYDGGVVESKTHFEQVYDRAVTSGVNAVATLDFAAKADNKLRHIADDTYAIIVESMRQDLSFRNRLIEIFGRPHTGNIGFGKVYPEGYEGPDSLLFAYLPRTTIDQIVPQLRDIGDGDANIVTFNNVYSDALGAMNNGVVTGVYNKVFTTGGPKNLADAFETLVGDNDYEFEKNFDDSPLIEIPVRRTEAYAFQAPADWGGRTSYGKIQRILEEMLREEIALDAATIDYIGFLQDWEAATERLLSELELMSLHDQVGTEIRAARNTFNAALVAAKSTLAILSSIDEKTTKITDAVVGSLPTVIGLAIDPSFPIRGVFRTASATTSIVSGTAKAITESVLAAVELVKDETLLELARQNGRIDRVSEIEGMIEGLVNLSGSDQPKRDQIGIHLQNLELKRQEFFTAQAEGFRLLREREAFNKILAAKVQKNRYQDMLIRLSRNDAMSKYQTAFNHAAQYAWLAGRAYDYETSLDEGDPAAVGGLLDKIVKERQLGLWSDGQPQNGQGGLAEILNQMQANFAVLKGQLGLNSPQEGAEKISLRHELFRIGDAGNVSSDDRWEDALKARIEPDLNRMPEFVRHCRPATVSTEGPQPGIVLRFRTTIEPGKNVFGLPLAAGDHTYSSANFATKVRGYAVWLENYNNAGLATTPRAYLVPVGNDYTRVSTAAEPVTRMWGVVEQRIPTPFVINPSEITAPGYIPTLNGIDGGFSELRRHGDFRMYHDAGGSVNESELILDSRLIGRSVWNSEWMLIIPGSGLHVDPDIGLKQLAETVSDIKLHFRTYSHQGQ